MKCDPNFACFKGPFCLTGHEGKWNFWWITSFIMFLRAGCNITESYVVLQAWECCINWEEAGQEEDKTEKINQHYWWWFCGGTEKAEAAFLTTPLIYTPSSTLKGLMIIFPPIKIYLWKNFDILRVIKQAISQDVDGRTTYRQKLAAYKMEVKYWDSNSRHFSRRSICHTKMKQFSKRRNCCYDIHKKEIEILLLSTQLVANSLNITKTHTQLQLPKTDQFYEVMMAIFLHL